jgi:hypothetical protein
MTASPAPEDRSGISIPRARRAAVSATVAAAMCLASVGIGFAGGRLTAPDASVSNPFPSGVPGFPPAGIPSGAPPGFPAPSN